jgi:RNA polymerase sigma-70 factor (ECF subfamily)
LTEAADEDRELVERCQRGDGAAFDLLVRRYQRPIFHLTRRYLRHDTDAEDVTQRALVQAFLRIGSFRGESKLRSWLYRIAINLALNAVRDRARQNRPTEPEDAPDVADPVVLAQSRRRLLHAVDRLSPKQKLVVELRAFEELSFREVAEVVGGTEDAAKVNFHHALKRLRQLLDEGGPDGA